MIFGKQHNIYGRMWFFFFNYIKVNNTHEKSVFTSIGDNTFTQIDPLGRPTITAGSDNSSHTCCPSVRPSYVSSTVQNLSKQNKFQVKTMFTTGETRGLAEWIIDDTCLVTYV